MSFINDLELEASCRIAEAGGMLAGNGAGFRYVSYWLGGLIHMLPPARDGVARSGKVDRLGRPLQQGRGQGMMDEVIPVVIPALAGHPYPAIVEMVPVALKGSKGKGYGNRDLTLYHEVPFAMAADGIPFWVVLLRGTADALEMRRIDASGVILAQIPSRFGTTSGSTRRPMGPSRSTVTLGSASSGHGWRSIVPTCSSTRSGCLSTPPPPSPCTTCRDHSPHPPALRVGTTAPSPIRARGLFCV